MIEVQTINYLILFQIFKKLPLNIYFIRGAKVFNQTKDPIRELTEYSKAIKSKIEQQKFNTSNPDIFPNKSSLLKNKVPHHLIMMVEQAEKILALEPNSRLFGLPYHEDDNNELVKLFISDIEQFTTLDRVDLGLGRSTWAQSRIGENAFFHLANSPLLPHTYKSIDQHAGDVFDIYSIPFKLRIALELKLKTIIGFESCTITQNGKKTTSKELPFTNTLNRLIKINCLKTPCSLQNIQNIYQWACNFCHTGEKEYIWITMKALDLVSPLFLYQEQIKNAINITELWGRKGIPECQHCARLHSYKGYCRPLYYIKDDWTLQKIQDALNCDDTKKKGAPNKRTYEYKLSETNFAEAQSYYCTRSKENV